MGVIADGDRDIRVAFSAVDVGQLEDLYASMAAAARDLLDGTGPRGRALPLSRRERVGVRGGREWFGNGTYATYRTHVTYES